MYPDLCTFSLLLYPMVLKTISPGFGVRASLMLFSWFKFKLNVKIFKKSVVDLCLERVLEKRENVKLCHVTSL